MLKGLEKTMMDDLSFNLDWPDVEAPVDYRKIC
jgi:hypothetical protein